MSTTIYACHCCFQSIYCLLLGTVRDFWGMLLPLAAPFPATPAALLAAAAADTPTLLHFPSIDPRLEVLADRLPGSELAMLLMPAALPVEDPTALLDLKTGLDLSPAAAATTAATGFGLIAGLLAPLVILLSEPAPTAELPAAPATFGIRERPGNVADADILLLPPPDATADRAGIALRFVDDDEPKPV